MKKLFQYLAVNEKFHTGKSHGAGINAHVIMWMEFQKIDKSHAIIVKQVGYGNNRLEGKTQNFSANSVVFSLE